MNLLNKLFILVLLNTFLFAQDYDYKLKPIKVSENTYVFVGKTEFFNVKNGGDISNTAFITTQEGVIVIDTGSSKKYADQMLEEIKKITDKPIKIVINTHHHPDHFLGNSVFKGADIFATEHTRDDIKNNGDEYILNLTNITFNWMKDTEIQVPNKILNPLKNKYIKLGKHKLKVIYLEGHTDSDIALYDEYTKTLFASDLIFHNRIAATPHANIKTWIRSLDKLRPVDFKVLVPGHGPISNNKDAFGQMKRYLSYLNETLEEAAKKGLTVYEILAQERPEEFKNLAMIKDEFERSVINLYPKYENALMNE